MDIDHARKRITEIVDATGGSPMGDVLLDLLALVGVLDDKVARQGQRIEDLERQFGLMLDAVKVTSEITVLLAQLPGLKATKPHAALDLGGEAEKPESTIVQRMDAEGSIGTGPYFG